MSAAKYLVQTAKFADVKGRLRLETTPTLVIVSLETVHQCSDVDEDTYRITEHTPTEWEGSHNYNTLA